MANKKTSGVVKLGDRNFAIDKIIIENGRRVHIRATGFDNAQAAKEALPGLIEARRRDSNPLTTQKTFNDLCTEFVSFRSAKNKNQTLLEVRYLIAKHILPCFTGLAVPEALTFDKVSHWYRKKANSMQDSQARKNKIFGVMRQLIDRAWHWHYITSETHQDVSDIVQNVKLPSRAKGEKTVWSYEDEQRFLNAIPDDSIDKPMFTLLCYLGCRLGEFLGLQWKSFNQKEKTITINQQVIYTDSGITLSNELKTNESYRIDELDDNTFNLLAKYRSTLNSSTDDEFMFPSPYSSRTPLSRTEFRRRLNKWIKIAGVPRVVPHGIRHSKATMLAGVCQNAEDVACSAKFLGHSNQMMMNTYVHEKSVTQKDIIERLKEVHRA